MSDNGSAYISKAFAKACSVLKLKHIRTRPYTPRTNGKAERFIQTPLQGMGLRHAVPELPGAKRWMPRYLSIYNRLRKHSALGWRSPKQRLAGGCSADEPGETQQLSHRGDAVLSNSSLSGC